MCVKGSTAYENGQFVLPCMCMYMYVCICSFIYTDICCMCPCVLRYVWSVCCPMGAVYRLAYHRFGGVWGCTAVPLFALAHSYHASPAPAYGTIT